MTRFEFKQQTDRLSLAFEKKMGPDLLDLWWEECRNFPLDSVSKCVQHFIESDQKNFPRIGEFKTIMRGSSERRTPEGTPTLSASCSRCQHGICTVERISDGRKHSFAFRCDCAAGNQYSGFPLVPSFERTLKEARGRISGEAPSLLEQRTIFSDSMENFNSHTSTERISK